MLTLCFNAVFSLRQKSPFMVAICKFLSGYGRLDLDLGEGRAGSGFSALTWVDFWLIEIQDLQPPSFQKAGSAPANEYVKAI